MTCDLFAMACYLNKHCHYTDARAAMLKLARKHAHKHGLPQPDRVNCLVTGGHIHHADTKTFVHAFDYLVEAYGPGDHRRLFVIRGIYKLKRPQHISCLKYYEPGNPQQYKQEEQ